MFEKSSSRDILLHCVRVWYRVGETLRLVWYSLGETLRLAFEQTVTLSLAAEGLLLKGMSTNLYRTIIFPVV
jgi:hypothetical protein